jgi:hypothetical protein
VVDISFLKFEGNATDVFQDFLHPSKDFFLRQLVLGHPGRIFYTNILEAVVYPLS